MLRKIAKDIEQNILEKCTSVNVFKNLLYLSCFIKIGDILSRNNKGLSEITASLSSLQGDGVKTQNGGVIHPNSMPAMKNWSLQGLLACPSVSIVNSNNQ